MEYFTSNDEQKRTVGQALVQYGCCSRCVLRFLGLRDCYTFRKTLPEIKEVVDAIVKDKTTDLPEVKDAKHEETEINSASVADLKDEQTSGNIGQDVKDSIDTSQTETTHCENEPMDSSTTDDSSCVATNVEEKTLNGQSDIETETKGDSIPNVDSDGSKDKEIKEPLCVLCLGILQEFATEKFLEEIHQKVLEEDYHFNTYLCSLMIPTCIILREHSMFLHLQEEYSEIYEEVKESNIVPIKEVWKWRNGPVLRRVLNTPFNLQSPMEITLTFVYPDSDKECNFLFSLQEDNFRKRKQDRRKKKKELLSRASVAKAVYGLKSEEFLKYYGCPPLSPTGPCTCDIIFMHDQVYIAGRYNKYSRALSQTPWILDGVRKSELSVEEILCEPIDKEFRPSTHKFSSSGREDVDVKMLGTGRPFLVELVNPRHSDLTQEQVTQIQKTINESSSDVQVRDLQVVSKEETNNLKEGEIDKLKTYSALCWSNKPLSETQLDALSQHKDLTIYQKTPIRVLHRRPLSTRDKCIHSMSVKKMDEYHFQLELSTQAGTYVKEFVHGDLGRTNPNLCSMLGVECDILELDVKSIDLDWPKSLETQDQKTATSS